MLENEVNVAAPSFPFRSFSDNQVFELGLREAQMEEKNTAKQRSHRLAEQEEIAAS